MKKILIAILMMAPLATFAQKFGHVNMQEIMQSMPEYTTAMNELKTLEEQYTNDLKQMQEEIQRKAEAFDKEQATLPDNIKQRRQQEIQDAYQKYQESLQDNQQELQKAEQEKMAAVQTKLLDAVKAVGQEGGFLYIVTMNSLPYISTTLSTDVTALVKTKLGIK
jgi:outer membrane protein